MDFSDLGATPVKEQSKSLDFSDLGGRAVSGINPVERDSYKENYTGDLSQDVLQNASKILYESVKTLEPMAREGLNKISDVIPQPEPSGNLPVDIIKGTPLLFGKSVAETGAKTAPGYVSPLSLGMMGAGYAAKGISKIPLLRKGIQGTGDMLASGVEKSLGIPADSIKSVFNKPSSLFTAPTKETVRAAYQSSELPETAKSIKDITEKATGSYGATVKRAIAALNEYIESGKKDPSTILEGRKALDKQIALLDNQINQANSGSKSALLDAMKSKKDLRYMFNRILDEVAPLLRKADSLASENFKVEPFRQLTLPGKINFMSPEGVARSIPGLPAAVGATTAGVGTATKMASEAISQAPLIGATAGATFKNLTADQAKEYLKKANGDRAKAREMAHSDGYTWQGKK